MNPLGSGPCGCWGQWAGKCLYRGGSPERSVLKNSSCQLGFSQVTEISSSVCGVEGRYCQKAQEGSSLRDPCPGHQTGHRGCPIGPQADSGSFFPVMLWHAMLTPFLRDRFGRVEFDTCWWCSGGRQTREHVFQECLAWKDDIRTLWKRVGEASARDGTRENMQGRRYRGRKGFGMGAMG